MDQPVGLRYHCCRLWRARLCRFCICITLSMSRRSRHAIAIYRTMECQVNIFMRCARTVRQACLVTKFERNVYGRTATEVSLGDGGVSKFGACSVIDVEEFWLERSRRRIISIRGAQGRERRADSCAPSAEGAAAPPREGALAALPRGDNVLARSAQQPHSHGHRLVDVDGNLGAV